MSVKFLHQFQGCRRLAGIKPFASADLKQTKSVAAVIQRLYFNSCFPDIFGIHSGGDQQMTWQSQQSVYQRIPDLLQIIDDQEDFFVRKMRNYIDLSPYIPTLFAPFSGGNIL